MHNEKTTIFIDGSSGTAGLRIYDRLAQRPDIDLLTLPPELHHDIEAQRELLNRADIAFLCLPDAAAVEAVELVENPDIAAAVGKAKRPGQVLVGFAAETEHLMENAARKLERKNLDMIVANDVSQPGAGFNVDTNIATLLTHDGARECPLQSKAALAQDILDETLSLRGRGQEKA